MKENFNYTQVPYDYLHCLQAQCSRSTDCLRYQVTRHAGPKVISFSVVNPVYIAGQEEQCPYFREDHQVRFALGITHLYDNLTYAKAVKIRRILRDHLHRTTYYRIFRKERYITPGEQSFIHDVFRKEGIIEDPVYDECEYGYDW